MWDFRPRPWDRINLEHLHRQLVEEERHADRPAQLGGEGEVLVVEIDREAGLVVPGFDTRAHVVLHDVGAGDGAVEDFERLPGRDPRRGGQGEPLRHRPGGDAGYVVADQLHDAARAGRAQVVEPVAEGAEDGHCGLEIALPAAHQEAEGAGLRRLDPGRARLAARDRRVEVAHLALGRHAVDLAAGRGIDGAGVDHQGLGRGAGEDSGAAEHHRLHGRRAGQRQQHGSRARGQVLRRSRGHGAEGARVRHLGGIEVEDPKPAPRGVEPFGEMDAKRAEADLANSPLRHRPLPHDRVRPIRVTARPGRRKVARGPGLYAAGAATSGARNSVPVASSIRRTTSSQLASAP